MGAKPVDVPLPFRLNMPQAKLLCEKYRGQMITIRSMEMQNKLFSQLAKILGDSNCENHNRAWTGVSDEVQEGHFVDVYRGQRLDFLPFSPGEPNGEEDENCAFATNCGSVWYDTDCDDKFYSFCEVNQQPLLQIRGRS